MRSRTLRLLLVLAVLVAVIEALRRRSASPGTAPAAPTPWTPLEPTPPEPAPGDRPDPASSAESAWVEPTTGGDCPASHPLKAKASSKIVHRPGGLSYDRTHADRCYVDLDAAEADGFRAAKR